MDWTQLNKLVSFLYLNIIFVCYLIYITSYTCKQGRLNNVIVILRRNCDIVSVVRAFETERRLFRKKRYSVQETEISCWF